MPEPEQRNGTRQIIDQRLLFRPRPDHRHITDQHIVELWQLIETQLSDHPADAGNAVVFLAGKLCAAGVGTADH